MTIDEARALVDKYRRAPFTGDLRHANEGYLDTLARLERAGGLTPELKEAGDVIWLDMMAAFMGLAETMQQVVDQIAIASERVTRISNGTAGAA